jgi:hypothetical protein
MPRLRRLVTGAVGDAAAAVVVGAVVVSVLAPAVEAAVFAAAPASSWSISAARKLSGDPAVPDAEAAPDADAVTPEPAAGELLAALAE